MSFDIMELEARGIKNTPGSLPSPDRGRGAPAPPSKGWAEMVCKVYEVDPMVCPQCGGNMKVIAFLTDYAVVDRI